MAKRSPEDVRLWRYVVLPPDGGGMDGRRIGRFVILAGGLGMVVGAARATASEPLAVSLLAASLLLVGVAAWHNWAWGFGKLVAVGLLALGSLLFSLRADDLAFRWVRIVSAVVVLVGVLWSLTETDLPEARRTTDVTASVAWWRKWGLLVGPGVAVALVIGWLVWGRSEDEPPIETGEEGDEQVVLDDRWSITPDGDSAGSYIFSMIKTFSPLDEADVDGMGGRMTWPEIEIDLCDVDIYAAGDGFVQIGIVSPTTEGCPGMLPAFVDYGVPQTACLFVMSDGIADEHCAPLTESVPPSGSSTTGSADSVDGAHDATAFGLAVVTPRPVASGEQFTVQPDGEVQPFCGGFAELHVETGSGDVVSYAQLGDGVFVERSVTTPTWPACQPPRSDAPATFTVPASLDRGTYIVCITPTLDPAGCGTLVVQG